MKPGIANSMLVEQVRNTAAWLWDSPSAAPLVAIFDAAVDEPAGATEPPAGTPDTIGAIGAPGAPGAVVRTLRLRLAAHYATVATFIPTDVDAHIRHHQWMAIDDAAVLADAVRCVDEAAARSAAAVSARVTQGLSGHDGEWLAVRAGALGRALALGLQDQAAQLAAQIDAELEREERVFAAALEQDGPAQTALELATIVAHNLGDLSRVVTDWPKAVRADELRARYTRLGHADSTRRRSSFVLSGVLNKEIMALENHRFLALRKPRALRRSRALLLPIGPWFDAWGELIGTTPLLEEADRAEVVTALVELHLWSPQQNGCLRALAGLHRVTRGGLPSFVPELPARLRKEAMRGRIREAIDMRPEHFAARLEKRYRRAVDVRARAANGASASNNAPITTG